MKKVLDFITTSLGGMAYGLFATLIIGTIFSSIFNNIPSVDNQFLSGMVNAFKGLSLVLSLLTGAGIGIGIALSLKLDVLQVIVLAVVGQIASFFSLTIDSSSCEPIINDTFLLKENQAKVGDPLTIYLVCVSVILLMKLIFKKKTPVDILIIPLFAAISGLLIVLALRIPSAYVTFGIQYLVGKGSESAPFIMGIVVSTIMGMALTAPISSAAIAAMIFTGAEAGTGLAIAAGASVVGCSVQMIGFAVQSRKDNNIGEIISIGIGTSMLQFKNIIKHPLIWLPTIITSAVLGPISTCLLKLECEGSAAGMGTAGLVGQIGMISFMGNTWQAWVGVIVLQIIAPGLMVFGLDVLFRKLGLIRPGDLSLK